MPIRFTCDGCGKVYAVSNAAAGKRAKCAACGNVITVPTPPPAAVTAGEPLPVRQLPPTSVREKTDSVPNSPPARPANSFADNEFASTGWFYPSWTVLITLLLLTAAVSKWGRPFPTMWYTSLAVFPLLAITFLFVGMVPIASSVPPKSKGGQNIFARLPLLVVQIPIAVVRPILDILFRKQTPADDRQSAVLGRLNVLFFRSLTVALMSTAIVIIGYWSGDCPLNRRSKPIPIFQTQGQSTSAARKKTPGIVSVPADMSDVPAPFSARPRTAGSELMPDRP